MQPLLKWALSTQVTWLHFLNNNTLFSPIAPIHSHHHLLSHEGFFFFLICQHAHNKKKKYLGVKFSSVKYINCVVHSISRTYLAKQSLYPLNNSPFPFPPISCNHNSTFCVYEFATQGTSYKWNYTVFVICD